MAHTNSVLALAFGGLGLASAASAQEIETVRRVDISASLAGTYESNLLRLPDSFVDRLGRSRSDFRLSPALSLDVALPIAGQSAFLNGLAGYEFHARNSQLNRERLQLNGGGKFRVAICSALLAVDFARQQSDLADVRLGNVVDPASEEGLVNVETRLAYESEISCGSRLRLRPTLGYRREKVENSDRRRESGNYTTDEFRAGLRYARPHFGELSLSASYRKGRYDERIVPGAQQSPPTQIYTASISFNRQFGSQLTGSASLGFTQVDPNLADVERFRGLSWSADVTWTPGTRFQTTLGASREATQSNLLSISYAVVDAYRIGTQYALSDRLTLSAGASSVTRSLRDSTLIPGAVLDTKDRTYRATARAQYAVNRRLSLSLDGGGDWRRSDLPELDYDNLTLAVTTRLSI